MGTCGGSAGEDLQPRDQDQVNTVGIILQYKIGSLSNVHHRPKTIPATVLGGVLQQSGADLQVRGAKSGVLLRLLLQRAFGI